MNRGDSLSRGLLRGIYRFATTSRRWFVRHAPSDQRAMETVANWKPDGVIAAATTEEKIRRLQELGVPVVNTSGRVAVQPFPQVITDHRAAGRMAAEHFLGKGYRNFGLLADPDSDATRRRWEGYVDRVSEAGFMASRCDLREDQGMYDHWERAEEPLAKWLGSLPKPLAVHTGGDDVAVLLSQVCMNLGIAVPERVAILGLENDELVCSQGYPPLSSIQTASARMGFEAAGILDRLIDGGEPPAFPLRIPPLGVVTRGSTDILAIEDEDVAAAVRYIKDHACDRIGVAEVAAQIPTSRRRLERRFRQCLGRSLLDEIHRVRVEHAKFLLSTSMATVAQVAQQAGFDGANRLWAVFRSIVKMSPKDYRAANQN